MIYLMLTLAITTIVTILFLQYKNQCEKIIFKEKIQKLENIIVELNQKLALQSQKVKLSENLKMNMRLSNKELSEKIIDINLEIFQEMFPKKNL